MFVWMWLVVNDRKFSAGTVFFSHTNQPAVLLHEQATIRTSQPNRLEIVRIRSSSAAAANERAVVAAGAGADGRTIDAGA